MHDITYSSEALDTLPKFHRKKLVIYVEGDDDVPFWNAVFQAFEVQNFIIKPAGGTNEIEKYTESILRDDSEIYIARDSDFKELLQAQDIHPRIIWTYGHSIENTLYHPIHLAEIISIYARTQEYAPSQAENWLNNFSNEFRALLICEISNEIYKRGVEILGDKCCRFLMSNKSCIPSRESIIEHFNKIRPGFTNDEYSTAENILNLATDRKPIFFLMRGHFLTHAVTNFIKNEVKKIHKKEPAISQDNLFATLVTAMKSECISNPNRTDINYLKSQISAWLT